MNNKKILSCIASTMVLFGVSACSTISSYDQIAYQNATSAKAETLAVMSKATNSYSSETKSIQDLQLTLSKAYEYDKGRPLNQITIRMWDILLDPNRDLLGGFLRDWKADNIESETFIDHKKQQIAEGFDIISGLESAKMNASDAKEKVDSIARKNPPHAGKTHTH